jgi:hypothetical protein
MMIDLPLVSPKGHQTVIESQQRSIMAKIFDAQFSKHEFWR